MTHSILTPADDFTIAAQHPDLLAWCRHAAPEEMERFSAHGRAGTDFAKLMAAHGADPVMFVRQFKEARGSIHRTPIWLFGDIPAADDLPSLRFLDRCDPREVAHLRAHQSLQFETFLRWYNKRPEKLKHWLSQ